MKDRLFLASLYWCKLLKPQLGHSFEQELFCAKEVWTSLKSNEQQKVVNLQRELAEDLNKSLIQLSFFFEKSFPLQRMPDPVPFPVLSYFGDLALLKRKVCVGIVGSRRPHNLVMEWLVRELPTLSKQVCVLSGGAHGVDQAVHRICLRSGIKTGSLLPSGLLSIYPKTFLEMSSYIVKKGGVLVSPLPPRSEIRKHYFHLRNRLLALCSDHVVLVQAGLKSGTMVTAQYAMDFGKEIYVVPQAPSRQTLGGLELVKEGAQLITQISDVF